MAEGQDKKGSQLTPDNCGGFMLTGCAVRFTKIDGSLDQMAKSLKGMYQTVDEIKGMVCGNGEIGMGEVVRNLSRIQEEQHEHLTLLAKKQANQIWGWWKKLLAVTVVACAVVSLVFQIVRDYQ